MERIDASGLDLKDQVISINRVTKVVKGGKNLSFSALVVVGNESGIVGFGTGKAREVPLAIKKGIEAAKKNLVRIPLAGSTIPHQVLGVFGEGRPGRRIDRRRCGHSKSHGVRHNRRVARASRALHFFSSNDNLCCTRNISTTQRKYDNNSCHPDVSRT